MLVECIVGVPNGSPQEYPVLVTLANITYSCRLGGLVLHCQVGGVLIKKMEFCLYQKVFEAIRAKLRANSGYLISLTRMGPFMALGSVSSFTPALLEPYEATEVKAEDDKLGCYFVE